MSRGAIILCGGRSRRMGCDKALLPFGPGEVLLQRVVRIVAEAVPIERIACVASADQELPTLVEGVQVVRDDQPACGPLFALVSGLAALGEGVNAVFACGCDAPLLKPAFVGRLFDLLGDHQIVAPRVAEIPHPLAAVYRADVLPVGRLLLSRGERSLQSLLAECDVRWVAAEEFRDVDPDLDSLVNCNTVDEYQRALARALP
jgi:molybdopterin-guanine dinucleotide biosynthesis protein A